MMKMMKLLYVLAAFWGSAALAGPWDGYQPPRLQDGTPDLQGTWTNASVTPLERPAYFDSLAIDASQAKRWEAGALADRLADAEPTDPNAPAPRAGANVGGYNRFWTDSGSRVARINGEYRSSWIVDPTDGKLPWSSPGRSRHWEAVRSAYQGTSGPEVRAPGERCLIGYGSSGGPPMLNVLYNNNYQIVQTPRVVAILIEMVHDTRLVRINDTHRPKALRGWLGDSVGRWEGDVLIVETTNFHPDASMRTGLRHRVYLSAEATVVERFSRVSQTEIFYEFTVTDAEIYTQPWRAEMVLAKTDGPIYEYACHEANYSMFNILAGARREEGTSQ